MPGLKTDDDIDFDHMIPGLTQPGTDDDVEITFVDSDGLSKGQNEDGQRSDPAQDQPDVYDDPRFQEALSRERGAREAAERSRDTDVANMERAVYETEKSRLQAQRDSFKMALDAVDTKVQTARQAMKMAREEGDTSAEIDLQSSIEEYNRVRNNIETNYNRLPSDEALDAAYRDHIAAKRNATAARPAARGGDDIRPTNDKAASWQRHNAWMTGGARSAERAALLAINNQLVAEGLDAGDDKFYAELSKRTAKIFPHLAVKDLNGRQLTAATSQPARAPSAPVAGTRTSSAPPSGGSVNRGRVELTEADRSIMKALRINTADKASVQRYAREKFNRLRREAQEGAR